MANPIIKLQNLKDYLRKTDTGDDQLLSDMIDDITDQANDYLNVRLGPKVTAETCILDGGKSYLMLPILNVSNVSIILDTDRLFTDPSLTMDPGNYSVDSAQGVIELNQRPAPGNFGLYGDYNVHGQYGQWGYMGLIQPAGRIIFINGNKIIQATYNGGYDYDNLPGSLRRALIRQLAYNYKRMPDIGISSVNVAGTSITKFNLDEWLPDVKSVLDNYKRISLVGD